MSHEAIALWTETSSDPELIAGVRAGDGTAFGVLYERHVDAARKVASQYTNSPSDVDDVVAESFSRVLRALQRGDGPDLAFRAYLFTIVRRTGMDTINRGNRTRPGEDMGRYEQAIGYEAPSDEGALAGFEQSVVADAFRSLPERWQAVLWYTEVEKKSPREIAPLLGLTANGVAALAYRAREALRQAYLQQHLNESESLDCLAASAQLGAYVRGGLAKREQAKVSEHVESCERCAALVAELEDVNRGMRAIIAPLVLGALGVAALEGGLPIGGALGPNGAGAAGAQAAGNAAAGGTATATTGASGFIAALAGSSPIVLPAAAAVGLVALVVSGAAFLGLFSPSGDNSGQAPVPTPAASPDPGATAEPDPVDEATAEPEPTDPADDPDDLAEEPLSDPIDGTPIAAGPAGVAGGHSNGPGTGGSGSGGSGTGGGDDGGTGGDDGGTGGDDGSGGDGGDGGSGGDGGDGGDDGTGGDGGDGGSGGDGGDGGDDGTGGDGGDGGTGGDGGDDGSGGDDGDGGGDLPSGSAQLTIARAPLDYLEISRTEPAVDLGVTNDGDADADDVTASITLPEGLTFAPPAGGGGASVLGGVAQRLAFVAGDEFDAGDWRCVVSDDSRQVNCTLATLAQGSAAKLGLRLAVGADNLADEAVTIFTVSGGGVEATYSVRTALKGATPGLPVVDTETGGLGIKQFGSTVLGCNANPATAQACYSAMMHLPSTPSADLRNNTWGKGMVDLNDAEGTHRSGSTTVTLPEGAVVTKAYLEWSANRYVGSAAADGWAGDLDTARIRAGGHYETVAADDEPQTITRDSRQYYVARADVTALVKEIGSGTYDVADIAVAATRNDPTPTYYGGFTITVIYSHPEIPTTTRVALFAGPHWVSSASPVEIRFSTEGTAVVTPSWTAYESDRGESGDRLTLNGTALTPLREHGRGTATANDAADSTAFGSPWANALGVDARPFQATQVAAGVHAVRVSTSGDNFMIGSLAVTIEDVG